MRPVKGAWMQSDVPVTRMGVLRPLLGSGGLAIGSSQAPRAHIGPGRFSASVNLRQSPPVSSGGASCACFSAERADTRSGPVSSDQ